MASTTAPSSAYPSAASRIVSVPKCPAQPGHMVLHGVSRRRRKLASPERLDQRVRRHDPTCAQGQTGDEGLPLRARHLHRLPGDDHLERPQEPNLELSHMACPPLSRAVWHAGRGGVKLVLRGAGQRRLGCEPSAASGAVRPAAA